VDWWELGRGKSLVPLSEEERKEGRRTRSLFKREMIRQKGHGFALQQRVGAVFLVSKDEENFEEDVIFEGVITRISEEPKIEVSFEGNPEYRIKPEVIPDMHPHDLFFLESGHSEESSGSESEDSE